MANLVKIKEYIAESFSKQAAKALKEHASVYSFSALASSVDRVDEATKESEKESAIRKGKKIIAERGKVDEGYKTFIPAHKPAPKKINEATLNEEYEGHIHALSTLIDHHLEHPKENSIKILHHAAMARKLFKTAQHCTALDTKMYHQHCAEDHLAQLEKHL